MRLFFGQVSNIRLRLSPRVDIRAACAGEAATSLTGGRRVSVGWATVIVLGGFFVVDIVCMAIFGSPEGNLQKRFVELDNLQGRTRQEIVAAVGDPNSISQAGGGKSLLQWMKTSQTGGYRISLLFNAAGICEGITHQSSHKAGF
jgi:hypothetical protein